MKTLLFIIDPQVDFTRDYGSLYVPKAEDAMSYLADFIDKHEDELTDICISLDSHNAYHIGHATYWNNTQGEHPAPFTQIIDTSLWKPSKAPLAQVNTYLDALNQQGRTHTIWPDHCIINTSGWAIDPTLLDALESWNIERKNQGLEGYTTYKKGSFADAEMFSVLSTFDGTLVSMNDLPINFSDYDRIYIAGVAEDICVAETVRDLVRIPYLQDKLYFIKHAMAGLDKEAPSLRVFDDALKDFGAHFI